jgi:AAA+ superfamily predicted ATPase
MDPEKAIKSIMFYGPSGTGKTLAVEAVSHELGALMIHLTPGRALVCGVYFARRVSWLWILLWLILLSQMFR